VQGGEGEKKEGKPEGRVEEGGRGDEGRRRREERRGFIFKFSLE